MTKIKFIAIILLVLVCTASYAQKVKYKYKEIYGLLSNKQYEAAEPFLKSYLIDNDDNPNAFLFMGIIFHEKSLKEDILKQTGRSLSLIDSAILYYDRAAKTITEKEIKKNKEYYDMFNRRDLRTGEFGVKISDIQFDLEKRTQSLQERADRVKMVKFYFALADSLYNKSNVLYLSLQKQFPTEKSLFLQATEQSLRDLSVLSVRYDSVVKAFDNYKSSANSLGKFGYNQKLSVKEITDYSREGTSSTDFYSEDIEVWNYRKFAENARATIQKEILPMRDHLVAYDVEINKLREKLTKDSVSVSSDLTLLIDKLLAEKLSKFDAHPLPIDIFSMKIADLEYRSLELEKKPMSDTANVHTQLKFVTKQMSSLKKLDSLSSKLLQDNLDERAKLYDHFITNTFSNTIVLKSYVKALKEFAEREKRKKDVVLAQRKEALRWVVVNNDSIPLFVDVKKSTAQPLIIEEEKYTVGLKYQDSLNVAGYFYTITPSRIPDIKISFAVDKPSFKASRFPTTKALALGEGSGQLYFVLVYSETAVKDKYACSLAKIYKSDGLAWNVNHQLGFLPTALQFKSETGELIVVGSDKQSVIDKNGKLK